MSAPPPIPLTLLCGVTGAGKTRLLNRVLGDPAMAGSLVAQNEIGAARLDMAAAQAPESDIGQLKGGCYCCAAQGELAALLEGLLRRIDNGRMPPFSRLIIEAAGFAEPAPMLASVRAHPYLSRRYAIAGVATVLEPAATIAALQRRQEPARQIALADVLIAPAANPTDLAAVALGDILTAMNPAARRLTPDEVARDPMLAFGAGLHSPALRTEAARGAAFRAALSGR